MSEIRVIIIDDEKMITRMLKGYLEDHGCAVKTANTGKEGLAFLAREPFEAAIVDLRLPDMDGSEVIARGIKIQPQIKCFIHTGSIDYVPSEDLISMGIDIDSIIHKPVLNMADIFRMIEKKLGKDNTLTFT